MDGPDLFNPKSIPDYTEPHMDGPGIRCHDDIYDLRALSRKQRRAGKVGVTELSNRHILENYYLRSLQNVIFQIFEWKNLPQTIKPEFIEHTLHTQGQIAFYKDPDLGHMAVRGAFVNLNPYGEPLEYQAAMWRYNRRFPLYNHLMPIEIAQEMNVGVYCPNMFNGMESSMTAITLFAKMLAENKLTYLVAQNTLKVPYILQGTKDQQLTLRNIYHNVVDGQPAVVVDDEFNMDSVKVHQLFSSGGDGGSTLNSLSNQQTVIFNEVLKYFGIDNYTTNKKERLVSAEITSNLSETAHRRNSFLYVRQRLARNYNLIHGTNIEVGLREDIQQIIEDQLQHEKGDMVERRQTTGVSLERS